MIPIYNRYVGGTGKFYRVEDAPPRQPRQPINAAGRGSPPPPPPPPPHQRQGHPAENMKRQKPPSLLGGGLSDMFGSLLPEGLETGDLLLLLVLLFLYIESKDEEFLIILAVVGYSILGHGENGLLKLFK